MNPKFKINAITQTVAVVALILACVGAKASQSEQQAQKPQENYRSLLLKIQDTHWQGNFGFSVVPVGLGQGSVLGCDGPLKLKFFPAEVEPFSNGEVTVSYRHDADFTQNSNPLCQKLGKKASLVDIGDCGESFPMKYAPEENKMVPFRTLIPKDNGDRLVVSSPSCNKKHGIDRSEFDIEGMTLSPDGQTLTLQINIEIGRGVLPIPFPVNVHYELKRAE